jgi:hypothetical protein
MGPAPSASATVRRSPSPRPMNAKFSGKSASTAPSPCAWASSSPATPRLAATSGPEAICSTDSRVMVDKHSGCRVETA